MTDTKATLAEEGLRVEPSWRVLVERLYSHGVIAKGELIEAIERALFDLKSSPASPTELEKELTAALRDLLYQPMNSDAHRKADAVLTKATERGL